MKRPSSTLPAIALCMMLVLSAHPQAQTATPAAAVAPVADGATIGAMAWLSGCWTGIVNQRAFREQWSPLQGGMMLGTGHTVHQGKTQSYEQLRLEARPDGVYYVALPSGQKEAAFKLVSTTTDDRDLIFTFANPEHDFPQRIIYRQGTEGWLYATIEGKMKGEDRKVIYPMRRVGCESGELILK